MVKPDRRMPMMMMIASATSATTATIACRPTTTNHDYSDGAHLSQSFQNNSKRHRAESFKAPAASERYTQCANHCPAIYINFAVQKCIYPSVVM